MFSLLLLLRYHFFFSQYFFCLFLFYSSEVFFNLAYQNRSYVSAFPTLYFLSLLHTVSLPLFPNNDSDYSSFPFPTFHAWKGITNAVPLPQPVSSFRQSDISSQFLFLFRLLHWSSKGQSIVTLKGWFRMDRYDSTLNNLQVMGQCGFLTIFKCIHYRLRESQGKRSTPYSRKHYQPKESWTLKQKHFT